MHRIVKTLPSVRIAPPAIRAETFCGCDFEATPNVDPATIHTLAKCDWVKGAYRRA
ncbi:hypothetical protein NJBCHELONAE_34060 [Mycobacteroides chelonae]|nr:hypothetical protein NJBCHELONAE_34060 [Mycobacteroides chelonae]